MIFLRCALALAVFSTTAFAETKTWERRDGCRLLAEKYFDGDSFHVAWRGQEAIVRLYFADAPETDAGLAERVREQAQYFAVNGAWVLRTGQRAKDFTARFLDQPFTIFTRRQSAPGASKSPRIYALVERRGKRLDEALLAAGLARANAEVADYPDATTGQATALRLRAVEQQAARSRSGVWSESRQHADTATVRKINLNTASRDALTALPGIGPKLADEIIRARPIRDFAALDAVRGIGAKKIEALRELVTFD